MKPTRHSKKRIRQRVGINKKSVEKLATSALTNGIPAKETTGQLKAYLTKINMRDRPSNNIRVYNRIIFVFNNDRLITVFNLPTKYHKFEDAIKQKRKNGAE